MGFNFIRKQVPIQNKHEDLGVPPQYFIIFSGIAHLEQSENQIFQQDNTAGPDQVYLLIFYPFEKLWNLIGRRLYKLLGLIHNSWQRHKVEVTWDLIHQEH